MLLLFEMRRKLEHYCRNKNISKKNGKYETNRQSFLTDRNEMQRGANHQQLPSVVQVDGNLISVPD